MQFNEKIKLLKALPILHRIPDRQLTALAGFLRPKEIEHGGVLFLEGSIGMSLYFVSSGHIRISMHISGDEHKDLAILGPGEILGESALVEKSSRMASATAIGNCVLFELFCGDLSRWTKSNPQQAVQFFAELVHIQSSRLRRTSSELTLQSDLAGLLLDETEADEEYLGKVLDHALSHLEGVWSTAIFLRGEKGAAASRGESDFTELAVKVHAHEEGDGVWVDASTYHIRLIGRKGPHGRLFFHSNAALRPGDQDDIARAFTGVAQMIGIALDIRRTLKN